MSNIVFDKIAYDLLLKIRNTNKYNIENQYKNEIKDGKLKINKEEAKTVKLIYNLFLKGLSYYQIKKELENKKLKIPFGNLRWHQSTVKSILTNEKYKDNALL